MGKKRTASESRHGAEKPFQKHEKGQNQSKDNHHGGRGSKSAPSGQKSSLTFQPRPDWHAAELPAISIPDEFVPAPRYVLDDVYQYAESLLESENKTYADSNMSADSSHKFLSTIMASGTLEDKVSALTLLIQESPLHTMKAFENLLGLASKKSRNQALLALGALKDLLGQGVVLPPDRKLRSFVKQPAVLAGFSGANANWKKGQRLPPGIENVHLISWAYEDWLKRTYFEMLRILEGWCNDEVEYSRSRAITFVYELLKEKPEQEENLLRLLINKLGDNEKKIASRASYLLLQLQNSHPVMKGIIIGAIESECLFRPNQSPHAKYYAIITLNQTILSAKEPEVANKLLEIYFALFLSLLKKGPKSETKDDKKAQGGGGQAGKKAKQKAKAKEKEQEKAANAESELNEKLIAGVLTGVNRAFPYAKTDDVAFEKQLDTVFRVTHSSNFNTAIQALLLIQQISATKHYSTDRFYRTLYESLLDPRLLHSSKQVMYLNLLYRSLKADVSIKRVKAFVKRLLQVITLHEPPFVCGVLYLIYELTKTFPSIKTMLETPELDDDDEEEHFVDAPEEADDTNTTAAAAPEPKPSTTTTTGPRYDGRKRDPDHAHADLSCLWDLTPLRLHFHPSVSLFASRLLYGATDMPPKPDPTLHTLMHFLDRFAYRNARQKGTAAGGATKGVSIMQPMAGSATKADLLVRAGGDAAKLEAPLNSEAFWRKKVEDVAADEVFFHQYFEKSGVAAQKKGRRQGRKAAEEDDEEGAGSDAEEQEIWKALVGSRPDVAGPDEEDDEDLEELDELMDDDESDGEDEDGGVVIADAPDDDEEDEEEDDDEEMVDAKVETKKEKKKSKAKDEVEEDEGSDAGFDFDDGDEGAFIGSDEELELPSDFDWEDAEDDEEEVQEEKPKKGKKGKKGEKKAAAVEEEAGEEEDKDKRGKKRRKLKHLPTFASVEDYAKLLGDDSDGY